MSIGRRQYPFDLIEPKWQSVWDRQRTFRAWNPGEVLPSGHPFAVRHGLEGKTATAAELPPKYYVLDMFPYPSGAGLHVGHPEGYTATDILARYRRATGFNVLHPMGWDAFGLPAEQYAIKTGQHPRATTEANIANFKRQIQSLGFSYDWSREVDTTDPKYFKWTQWIFLKLYNSWFNPKTNKAEPIETLEYPPGLRLPFSTSDETELRTLESNRQIFRDSNRLAFVKEAPVWWCEQLGTVLANEEVVDGKSEVGGFPVVHKLMRQWMLRITKYAERLLNDLNTIDWSDSLKEMQRNWIGRSEGAYIYFSLEGCAKPNTKVPKNSTQPDPEVINLQEIEDFIQSSSERKTDSISVFTTRPDTLYGATYMVLAPEHQFLNELMKNGRWPEETLPIWKGAGQPWANTQTSHGFKPEEIFDLPPLAAVETYRAWVSRKSDLERTELAKEKTGVFTGLFAVNPVNNEKIPIFMADYVLATYGTGAIMAVPAHDERDWGFAKKFNLPIKRVVYDAYEQFWRKSEGFQSGEQIPPLQSAFCEEGIAINSPESEWRLHNAQMPSGFSPPDINDLPTPEAKTKITAWLEERGLGKKTINYKLRDWLFSRQRYWGEPFPIIWKRDDAGNLYHEALPESALPLLPPKLDDYRPAPDGQPPLARAKDWVNLPDGSVRETNTMPQWAGSCWYYLRFLDAQNPSAFVGKDAEHYWMGGAAVKTLNREDVKTLKRESVKAGQTATTDATTQSFNDSTIQRFNSPAIQPFNDLTTHPGVDLYVGGTEHAVLHLLYARFWHKVLFDLGYVSTPEPFFKLVNQGLILGEDGQKMSKSRGNVVNPDDILKDYGADAFRLYEMFLGPLEMVKPWNTKGVEGVYRFLGRVWRLFVDEKSETEFEQALTTESATGVDLLDKIQLNSAIVDIEPTPAQLKALHACIKKVTEDLDALRFNTAISALMVFNNEAMTWDKKPRAILRDFLILLQPFAPHLAEELASRLGRSDIAATGDGRTPGPRNTQGTLAYEPWPKYDPALLVESTVEIPVQVNGKLRDKIVIAAEATQAEIEAAALACDKIKPFIEGKTIKKIIYVPKRLVNIAVG